MFIMHLQNISWYQEKTANLILILKFFFLFRKKQGLHKALTKVIFKHFCLKHWASLICNKAKRSKYGFFLIIKEWYVQFFYFEIYCF